MKENDLTLEQCINELKSITEQLKRPELSLDDSIKLYEKGKTYSDRAKEILNDYKDKIEIIKKTESSASDEE